MSKTALTSSQKRIYANSFLLSLLAAVTVQKNVRDIALADAQSPPTTPEEDA